MRSRRLTQAVAAALLAGCAAKPTPPAAGPTTAPRPAAQAVASVKTVGASPEAAAGSVRRGVQAYGMGDLRGAARAFEQALAVDPTNRAALWHLALIAERMSRSLPRPQSSPFYLRSAEMLRRLHAAHPVLTQEERESLPNFLYNEACTYAIDGESGRAVAALADSIDAGFADLAHIEADPELDSLRKLPDFQLVTGRLERRLVLAALASTKPYPLRFTLTDLDGKTVTPADFRGKILVVDFWGDLVPSLPEQVPNLVALHKRYRDRGLAVVGIAYESAQDDDARKVVRAFAAEAGITYPCLIGNELLQAQVPGFAGYPTTLFLDRAGNVRLRLSGYQPLSTLETAAAALLGETQGVGTQEAKNEQEKGQGNDKGKPPAPVAVTPPAP